MTDIRVGKTIYAFLFLIQWLFSNEKNSICFKSSYCGENFQFTVLFDVKKISAETIIIQSE